MSLSMNSTVLLDCVFFRSNLEVNDDWGSIDQINEFQEDKLVKDAFEKVYISPTTSIILTTIMWLSGNGPS